jgi:predicted Zn-dependent protease
LDKIRYYLSGILLLFTVFSLQSCLDSTGANGGQDDINSYSHVQNPGASANDFMADSNFTNLVVEVDYMPGYAPNEKAVDSLKQFFEQRLHKSSITIKEPTEIPSGNKDLYSATEIRNLEEQNRSTFTKGDTLAAYFVILDGKFDKQNLLGIAYYNTSNAFFRPSYDEASSGVGSPSRYLVEATSFRHEFGHLFGLVANPYSRTEMQDRHNDPDHPQHCNNDQCLMYYAIETTDIIGNTLGKEVPSLDNNCKADLRANGGK